MPSSEIRIEACANEADIAECFACLSEGFGSEKPLLNALYPDHRSADGRARGIARLQAEWRAHRDDATQHYLKAVDEHGTIAGFAIWAEVTATQNLSAEDVDKVFDLERLYPAQEQQQAWLRQVWHAYVQPRRQAVHAFAADGDARPVMLLELCVVRPTHQRRGIGVALTEWGLERGRASGAGKAIVEASVPGTGCYARCGFVHRDPIDFTSVDASLTEVRRMPTLVFMQTDAL